MNSNDNIHGSMRLNHLFFCGVIASTAQPAVVIDFSDTSVYCPDSPFTAAPINGFNLMRGSGNTC